MIELPDWLPEAVREAFIEGEQSKWRLFKDKYHFDENDEAVLRLLTSDEMRPAWQKIAKLSYEHYRDGAKHAIAGILSDMGLALLGPMGTQQDTAAERAKRLKEINATAEKLARLLEGTEFEWQLMEDYIYSALESGLESFEGETRYKPGLFSKRLHRLSKEAESAAFQPYLSRPNDADAKRAFFVRYMTEKLRERYGMPLRSVVLAATAVAFDDCDIIERQISRLAP